MAPSLDYGNPRKGGDILLFVYFKSSLAGLLKESRPPRVIVHLNYSTLPCRLTIQRLFR